MSCDCTEFTCVMRGVLERTMMVPFQNEFYKQILASSTGSVVATVCLNPITVVKVKIQTSGALASNTLRNVFRNILIEKGVRGFWSGTPMGILMSVPNTVVYLAAYEETKLLLNKRVINKESSMHHLVPGMAGGLARLFAVSVITPLELIRTIQTGGINKSIVSIGREIVQNRGFSGLYGGWLPSVLRDCPFSAIYWYSFEVFRPRYSSLIDTCRSMAFTSGANPPVDGSFDNRTSAATNAATNAATATSGGNGFSVFATFLSGASSGMIAALVTHPYDVIKTKQQMAVMNHPTTTSSSIGSGGSNSNSSSSSSSSGTSSGSKVNIRSLLAEGGMAALYRGLSMRLVSVIPASAIVVTIYEKIKSIKF